MISVPLPRVVTEFAIFVSGRVSGIERVQMVRVRRYALEYASPSPYSFDLLVVLDGAVPRLWCHGALLWFARVVASGVRHSP